jgi:SAM-dependent methyltransferase
VSADPWYRSWFGEDYLKLYPHRDHEEAEDAVALLVERLAPTPGLRVLDLACGGGRHLHHLRARGLGAVGLDLSLPLLREAAETASGVPLVRGDMRRLPFGERSFGIVTSFFTSFGYFEDEAQDRLVLGEIRRTLAPGGWVVLDFLNAARVRRSLTPRDEVVMDGRRVVQERILKEEGRIVEKRIHLQPPEGGPTRTFLERVRLYDPPELEELLASRGFEVQERLGDYDGSPFEADAPRFILLARRAHTSTA